MLFDKDSRPKDKRTPSKIVLTGHEAYIENLRAEGAEVKLHLLDSSSSVGIVKAADKYTVSILTAAGTTEVVFKHAIAKLSPTKRGAKKHD